MLGSKFAERHAELKFDFSAGKVHRTGMTAAH
jgi:hypothetical protein